MKKSILIAVLGMAAAVAAYGQGRINFGNYYSYTQTTGVTYGFTYGAYGPYAGLGVGPEATAILLWGASTDTLISQLSPVPGSATPFGLGIASGPAPIGGGTGAGWFDGPSVSINGGTAGNYAFAIEATSTLLLSRFGFADVADSPIVVGPTQATFFSSIPNLPTALQQGSFHFELIPEPTVFALSGIGAAALMLARRRVASKPTEPRKEISFLFRIQQEAAEIAENGNSKISLLPPLSPVQFFCSFIAERLHKRLQLVQMRREIFLIIPPAALGTLIDGLSHIGVGW
jgi:hypothetical protein